MIQRFSYRLKRLLWMICLPCTLAIADEPYLDFARGLRDRGYADMAVVYLQQLAARAELPNPVRGVLDLELSNSYRAWSDQTSDAEQAKQRLLESERLLEQFTKQNPRHPGLAQAYLESGDRAFDRGERLWMRAERIAEPAMRGKFVTDAQQAFQVSLQQLRMAAERFKQLAAAWSIESALPANANATGLSPEEQKQRIELGQAQSRFKAGAAELYLARTYNNVDKAEQTAHLKKAAEDFEWAYRRYPNAELGMRALLWQAKATDELGQDADALDLYNDVLSAEPDAMGKLDEVAALFGQAAFWHLQLVVRHQGDETARNEGTKWLKEHRSWRETAPYQGIALETAKSLLKRAANEPAKVKEKLTAEAMGLLAEVAAAPGEFQNEAVRLQRSKGVVVDRVTPKGDWIVTGDTAMAAGKWTEAITAYESAVTAARTNPDAAALTAARNRLNSARYRLAASLYSEGKLTEALEATALVAKSGPAEPHAPEAASLSCFIALALYDSANETSRSDASTKLDKVAEFTRKTWPDQPPAHDADIVLGHRDVKQEKWDDALKRFEQVPRASSRFASAAFYAARIYWKRALDLKRQADGKADDTPGKKWSDQARAKLQAAIDSSTLTDAEAAANRSWFDCCLLLAEINLEENQHQLAIELLTPLLVRFPLTAKPTEPDSLAVALSALALRAYCASGQIEHAEERATALAQFGADTVAENAALLRFLQAGRKDVEEARAVLDRAKGSFQQAVLQETVDKLSRRQKAMTPVAVALAGRKQLNLPSLAFLAEVCGILDLKEPGQQLCQRILQEVAATGGSQGGAQYAMKARFQLASALKDQEHFAESIKQLDLLAADHPNSLELLMKKGEVLQAWSKKDPKRYEDCVAHWTHSRLLLSRVKPRPKEYYQVVYNTALCLAEQSQDGKDKVKSQQAQQLLKSTMVLSAGLDGPETVKRYEALLARLSKNTEKSK